MAERYAGPPWEASVEYNAPLSNVVTAALGGETRRATASGAAHPGLYHATYTDIPSLQTTIRPVIAVPPDQSETAQQLLAAGLG